jgi:monoamine oxidase
VSTFTGQTYRCSRLIFAVPPPALKSIDLSPGLPPLKKFFVDRMFMGSSIKFYATYDEPYWTRQGFSGQFLSNGGRKTLVTESGVALDGGPISWLVDGTPYSKVPMLVGFLAGKLAVEWSQVSEEELQAAILDQLCAIFGSWAREPAGFVIKNWSNDHFVHGAPSAHPAVGTLFAYHALRQSFGPIHFAGTETAIQ